MHLTFCYTPDGIDDRLDMWGEWMQRRHVNRPTVISEFNAQGRDVGQQIAMMRHMAQRLGQAAAARAHREVAEVALAGGFDLICGIGEFVPALEQLALGDPRILLANDVEDLWPQLQPRLAPDAAILLKASRGVALERLVPPLTTWVTA